MDFLLSPLTSRVRLNLPFARPSLGWSDIELREVGPGVAGVGASNYRGFEPWASDHNDLFLVLGDPLFDWTHWKPGANSRTKQLAERILSLGLDHPVLEAYHPATIIHVTSPRGVNEPHLITIRTDTYGALPVYVRDDEKGLFLSNSPDLIALQGRCKPDSYSEAELLSTGRVTFPFTLFEEILELPPSSLIEVLPSKPPGERIRIRSLPGKSFLGATASQDHARAEFTQEIIAFFQRLSANSPDGESLMSTLSAGSDSRFLTILAQRHWKGGVEAMTGSPEPNLHSATALAVAEGLSMPAHEFFWNPSTFRSRYVNGFGMKLGSHRDWHGNHFDGVSEAFGRRLSFGGIFADALVNAGGGPVLSRQRLIGAGRLSPLSHWSETTLARAELPGPVTQELSKRADALIDAIPNGLERAEDLRFAWPRNRALSAATYLGLMREWAHYEPFLCLPIAQSGMSFNPKRVPGVKSRLYKEVLDSHHVGGIPTNPPTSLDSASWLAKRELWRTRKSRTFFRFSRWISRGLDGHRTPMRSKELIANIFWARIFGS